MCALAGTSQCPRMRDAVAASACTDRDSAPVLASCAALHRAVKALARSGENPPPPVGRNSEAYSAPSVRQPATGAIR